MIPLHGASIIIQNPEFALEPTVPHGLAYTFYRDGAEVCTVAAGLWHLWPDHGLRKSGIDGNTLPLCVLEPGAFYTLRARFHGLVEESPGRWHFDRGLWSEESEPFHVPEPPEVIELPEPAAWVGLAVVLLALVLLDRLRRGARQRRARR